MSESVESILQKQGIYTSPVCGKSMLPLLRESTDRVVIKSLTGRIKRNDVVLYRNKHNALVLHRVIKVRKTDYIIRGDNRIQAERGISDNDIIGILDGYFRGEKYIKCGSFKDRLYILVLPLRRIKYSLFIMLKRILRHVI